MVRGDTQSRFVSPLLLHRKIHTVEKIGAIHPRRIKFGLRRQIHENFLFGQIPNLMQGNFHIQGLIKVGIQLVFPNP